MYGGDGWVEVESQGGLFKCVVHDGRRGGRVVRSSTRGRVGPVISARSRTRLMESMARVDRRAWASCMFVTVTTRRWICRRQWRMAMHAVNARIKRRFEKACAHWREGYQKAGRLHEHQAMHNVLGMTKAWLERQFAEVLGEDITVCDVERVRSWKQMMGYLARYMGSEEEEARAERHLEGVAGAREAERCARATAMGAGPDAEGGGCAHAGAGEVLDSLPYSDGEGVEEEEGGRWCGVWGRKHIAWGDLTRVRWLLGDWFYDLRRAARHKWAGVSGRTGCGFMLFGDLPEQWLGLAAWFMGGTLSRVEEAGG